jgi:DNA polymerase I-like protein with 3'-5' exonuclease and polymerase domains
MANVAIVEAKASRNNYAKLFNNAFEFEQFSLCSDPSVAKVLKKNVDLQLDASQYDWIVLVGSEACKYLANLKSVTEYSGRIVDSKFLPVINPSMLAFKPEVEKVWLESRDNIISIISGKTKAAVIDDSITRGIEDREEALAYIEEAIAHESPFIALDSETTNLYPRNGHMLGISMCYDGEKGVYISTDVIDEVVEERLQHLFNTKTVVFHNAKFDIGYFSYQFGFKFPNFEDTMLQHYVLDETVGTHGLKHLALKYTPYGDYEKPMYDWMDEYRRKTGVLKDQFNFGMIPFDVIKVYASMDALVTYMLHKKFNALINKNNKFKNVYYNILIPATAFIIEMQDAGIPFSRKRLLIAQETLQTEIYEAVQQLQNYDAVQAFMDTHNGEFNPNSTMQLRELLFDYVGLTPTGKKTEKGADSTDSEVLKELSLLHPIPELVLKIRKMGKIKNTYIDKILPQLDKDSRIRTGFNLHVTTSGRLSSSGKLNAQQFPRDNPLVKGCILAPPGSKIISGDLVTAEVYVASVLSKDKALQEVFVSGGNFHSSIAKRVFKLPCAVEEVENQYKQERQYAKAITFGIMYGAGPRKIWSQVQKDGGNITLKEASQIIDEYFNAFYGLKNWIDTTRDFIRANAFIYSHFGRKRRLPNVKSDNDGIVEHEIRSGLNFMVQSPASDINLIGAFEAHEEIKAAKMKAKIFALVHDSILAEVPDEEIEAYTAIVQKCIQRDRGLSIPGCPIGVSFEIGQDYSLGKLEKAYPHVHNVT